MKKISRGDVFLSLFLLVFLVGAFFAFRQEAASVCYAEISVDGELYKRVQLTGHQGREELLVETARGKNLIVVEGESIRVKEADCPDKICVNMGRLTQPGETAACLPHKLLIEVKKYPSPK